jgi:hypothetical protein
MKSSPVLIVGLEILHNSVPKTNPAKHAPFGRAERRTRASMQKLIRLHHFIRKQKPYPAWFLRRYASYPIQM